MAGRRKWGKRLGIGCLGVFVLLLAVGGVLLAWKPWAPGVEVVDPGPDGERITADGLVGNFYPSSGRQDSGGQGPAVLVLGGSEGGISAPVDQQAQQLQAEGFSALALSYWGADGQSPRLELIELEYFATALDWLGSQPQVNPQLLGVMGSSKGGEAAMLIASRHPELRAVVGFVPSHVVWPGIDLAEPWRMINIESSWSEGGDPLPALPYGQGSGSDLKATYDNGLDNNLAEHPEALIPIEDATAPILAVCGEDDTLWPSCRMSEALKERAEVEGGPDVTVLSYPDAGHFGVGPPSADGYPLDEMGGTVEGNKAARADGWPKVIEFLDILLR